MNEEMIAKAKAAKSVEELIALAKEYDMELTEEQAKEYFEQLHAATGELADDELDNVAGGGCKRGGYTVVTCSCRCFNGKFKPGYMYIDDTHGEILRGDNKSLRNTWYRMAVTVDEEGLCGTCYNLEFSGGIGLCGVSK